ncbi:SDR family oxidoreductase [Actinoallomurus purpureus]|uniref:SDR family oxidoreductase n=1 Tax=Actinoallomurus purpureus TaxID=478114 RepID=UPI002093C59E|nr:SDR family oxidoreductase [Actinoallomurus purpureus]MCO6006953.1 SDR family oxidoreductase [Actinoallomurus purpureus]
MTNLAGKTALVTGGSRGIGRAIALRLGRDGARVAVHYGRDEAAAKDVVAAIGEDRAFAVRSELSAPDAAEVLLGRVEEEFDGLDILVNNAAEVSFSGLEGTTPEEFDRVVAVNIRAPFFIIQRALPVLREGGRIINISSIATRVAMPRFVTYALTKGAVDVLGRTLAAELGARGITVNTVAPGVVETDSTAALLAAPGGKEAAAARSAFGRVGLPEDIADVVAFLASDDARWVTADWIDATGGSNL